MYGVARFLLRTQMRENGVCLTTTTTKNHFKTATTATYKYFLDIFFISFYFLFFYTYFCLNRGQLQCACILLVVGAVDMILDDDAQPKFQLSTVTNHFISINSVQSKQAMKNDNITSKFVQLNAQAFTKQPKFRQHWTLAEHKRSRCPGKWHHLSKQWNDSTCRDLINDGCEPIA